MKRYYAKLKSSLVENEENQNLPIEDSNVLYDIFRKRIYILGEIMQDTFLLFNNAVDALKLEYINLETNECELDEITIEIDSMGGSINSCFLILEEMKKLQEEGIIVNTCCQEFAMSAGCFILFYPTLGKRSARKCSRIMLHRPLLTIVAETPITYDSIKNYKKELDTSWLPVKEMIETKTNLPKSKIKLIEKGKDLTFTAEEALQYGIIDEIISL